MKYKILIYILLWILILTTWIYYFTHKIKSSENLVEDQENKVINLENVKWEPINKEEVFIKVGSDNIYKSNTK